MPWVPLAVALLLAPAPAAAVPDLPALSLADYPVDLAARVQEALARARQEPGSAAATGALGMLLHAYDQAGAAAECYRRARALDPHAFEWAYLDGLVEARLGRADAAREALAAAVRLRPRSVAARVKLGEALQATGDLEGSAALFQALLAEDPRVPQAHYGIGRVEAARGQAARAAEHLLEATRLFEGFGAAHYALALAYRDLGREDEARARLALYQKHLMDAPPLDDPVLEEVRRLKQGAVAMLAEGVRLGKAGELAAAIREHERAVEADPRLAQAHANLVSLYGRAERWDKVDEHYRAAAALAPGLADLHYDYGVALTQQGRAAEAAAAFERTLAINPYHARAHNNLGTLRLADRRFEEAADHFRRALENDPGYRLAGFNLGRARVAQGRWAEAIEAFRRILTPEDDETPRYVYALASAYVRAGDRENGVRYAREALARARALGQEPLAASIEKDLRSLEGAR
jgi:tetratricopeptide (TPR) repeat protein